MHFKLVAAEYQEKYWYILSSVLLGLSSEADPD